MNYKLIKSLKGFSNYEMSEDGQTVRDVRTKKELDILTHRGKTGTGVDLVSDDKSITKRFGLATLYRMSWYAAYPGAVERPRRPRGKPSVFKIESKKLFSEYTRREVCKLSDQHREHKTNVFAEFIKDCDNLIHLVIFNHDTSSVVLHVKSQSWRDGYWMYNYKTGGYERFSDEKHRRNGLKGDSNLLWPTL
jgi:hypothetical protein